jgi:hypothetical protein
MLRPLQRKVGNQAIARLAAAGRLPKVQIQRCKLAEEVRKGGSDPVAQGRLLYAYLDELNKSIENFGYDWLEDIKVSEVIQELYHKIEQVQDLLTGEGVGAKDVDIYADLVDGLTDDYQRLKAGTHPKVRRADDHGDDERKSADAGDERPQYEADIVQGASKKFKLKANSRPLSRRSWTVIHEAPRPCEASRRRC